MDRHIAEHISKSIRFSFSRSSGKGGQNVNKVNTKVTAHLPISACGFLSEDEKLRIRKKLAARINSEDEIVLQVQDERSQFANREKAVVRFAKLLEAALKVEKKRVKTKPSASSRNRRIRLKKTIGEKKRLRRYNENES
jgi:ribosome-associated protein